MNNKKKGMSNMSKNKKRWISIRASEIMFRKLVAICKVNGKTKTAVILDLIASEYEKNKKYEWQYYADLDKEV